MNSRYLIDDIPLFVSPTLAKLIGFNEALVLQKVHFWLKHTDNVRDGQKWVYNTYAEWHKQFPFWSDMTIRRTFTNLEKQQFFVSATKYNKSHINKTKWYTINYEKLSETTGISVIGEFLIDEPPVIALPKLADAVGLNEAMFLQQLHFYQVCKAIDTDDNKPDGIWIKRTQKGWLRIFTFWSRATLHRAIKKLLDMGLVQWTDAEKKSELDNTKSLTICYGAVKALREQVEKMPESQEIRLLQSEQSMLQSEQSDISAISSTGRRIRPESQEIRLLQSEQSMLQSEQSMLQSEQSMLQSEQIIYIDHITNTYYDDHIREKDKSGRIAETLNLPPSACFSGQLSPVPSLTRYVAAEGEIELLSKEFLVFFDNIIGGKRSADDFALSAIRDLLRYTFEKYGRNVLDDIFGAIKESDYLLGQTGVVPTLSWLLENIDAVLCGKYAGQTESLYMLAQKCNEININCSPSDEKHQKYCIYCQRWVERKNNTALNLADESEKCYQNFMQAPNLLAKQLRCPVSSGRDTVFQRCYICPQYKRKIY